MAKSSEPTPKQKSDSRAGAVVLLVLATLTYFGWLIVWVMEILAALIYARQPQTGWAGALAIIFVTCVLPGLFLIWSWRTVTRRRP